MLTTQEQEKRNWLPLEGVMIERHGDAGYCADYMFMGMHGKIYMYKNRDSRRSPRKLESVKLPNSPKPHNISPVL